MCVWGFACCGPPPHATIKAYDGSFNLDWHDLIDIAPGRESALSLFNPGTFTPSSPILAAGPGDGSSTREGVLLVRDATNGDRHEESTSSPLTAPQPEASRVTLVDDTATRLWCASGANSAVGTKLACFDDSLSQLCSLSMSMVFSLGCSMTDPGVFVGRRGTSGSIVERYNDSGASIDSLAVSSLSATAGRSVAHAAITMTRDAQTIVAFGIERTATQFWRRYWTIDPATLTVSAALSGSLVTNAALLSNDFTSLSEIGATPHVNSQYLIAQTAPTTGFGGSFVCVPLASLVEQWSISAPVTPRILFLGLDLTRAYFANQSTKVITAYTLATGATAWTLDLSSTWLTSIGNVFAKPLAGGYLAIVSASQGVALVNPATGSLVATIDVMAYDVIETASRYIVVGPKRTTSS